MPQRIEWVDIPAGGLQRGTPLAEIDDLPERYAATGVPRAWYEKEVPRTLVNVPAFRLARTPVTVAQRTEFATATGARVIEGIADHPVIGVAWDEANAFAVWVGAQFGEDVRLPTEDEWERAARGDDYLPGRANLVDLARCARRHGAYEPDLVAVGIGFRVAASVGR